MNLRVVDPDEGIEAHQPRQHDPGAMTADLAPQTASDGMPPGWVATMASIGFMSER